MAVKASANITIFRVREVVSTTTYYLLQSSTATPPSQPSTDNPGGNWVTTEPTYTEGSTNTLYTVTKTKYSDIVNPDAQPSQQRDFEYTPVSKSTAYEAAKAAYNKAIKTQQNLNDLTIDTSNLISNLRNKWLVGEYVANKNPDESGHILNTNGKIRYSLSIPVESGKTYQMQVFGPEEYVLFMTMYGYNEQGKSIAINSLDNIGHILKQWICPSNVAEIRFTMHNLGSYIVTMSEPTNWSTNYTDYYTYNSQTDTYISVTGNTAPTWEEDTYYSKNMDVTLNEIDTTIHVKIEQATKPSNFSYSYDDINIKISNAEDNMQQYIDSKSELITQANSTANTAKSEADKLRKDYEAKIKEYDENIANFDSSIQKNKKNIELMASLIGGNNLIRNSVGFNEIEYWSPIIPNNATIETNQSDLESVTISHSEFILTGVNGSTTKIYQNITLEENQYYNLSARIKHTSSDQSLNAVHIYAKIPGEDPVDLLYYKTKDETTGIETTHDCTTTEYNVFTKFNICEFHTSSNSVVEISIENTGSDIFEVSDLMLAVGTIPPVWSQHKEEIYGKTMILDVDGLKVYPKTTTNIKNTRHTKTTDTGFSTIEYNNGIEKETSVLNKERMLTKIGYLSEAHVLLNDVDLYKITTVHVSDNANGHYDIIEY